MLKKALLSLGVSAILIVTLGATLAFVPPEKTLGVVLRTCLSQGWGFCEKAELVKNFLYGKPATVDEKALLSLTKNINELAVTEYHVDVSITEEEYPDIPDKAGGNTPIGQAVKGWFGQRLTASATVVVKAGVDENRLKRVVVNQENLIVHYYAPRPKILKPTGIKEGTLVTNPDYGPGFSSREAFARLVPESMQGYIEEPPDLTARAVEKMIIMAEQKALEEGILQRAEQRYKQVLLERIKKDSVLYSELGLIGRIKVDLGLMEAEEPDLVIEVIFY